MKKQVHEYDMIYSLGMNCACAEYLRKNNLRNKSGPLDWLVSDDIYAPFKTVLDEFKTFLDFSNLTKTSKGCETNITLMHKANGYLLIHDFFTHSDIKEQMPSVHQKYSRRIERMLKDLNSNKRILFCWYGETGIVLEKQTLLSYIQQIRAKYKANIDFLFISYSNPSQLINKEEPMQGVTMYNLPKERASLKTEGFLFWDKENINKIISSLSLKNARPISTKIRGVFYRVIAAFIFNRAKRHNFIDDKLRNN